ncbi:DUF397 domain-containing protein [Streptomyces sp. NPDC019208]|uniref:DUF397 domain-containing protein n=1 Tax=unclassified Streptomyces TaxID=2593676 RepID=UPI0033D22799
MSDRLTWFTSSDSGGRGSVCAEVAPARSTSDRGDDRGGHRVGTAARPRTVPVRGSGPGEDGPRFVVAGAAWTRFPGGVGA